MSRQLKKVLPLLICFIVIFSCIGSQYTIATTPPPNMISVNDTACFYYGYGIPLRMIFEALGYEVLWNDADQSVEIVKGEKKYYVTQDDVGYLIRDCDKTILEGIAYISDNRMYVPISFLKEVVTDDLMYVSVCSSRCIPAIQYNSKGGPLQSYFSTEDLYIYTKDYILTMPCTVGAVKYIEKMDGEEYFIVVGEGINGGDAESKIKFTASRYSVENINGGMVDLYDLKVGSIIKIYYRTDNDDTKQALLVVY